MQHILRFILLCNLLSMSRLYGQTGTVSLNNETYYIYPFRLASYDLDIPFCASKLPDGQYVAFLNYQFRYDKDGHKKLVEKDTGLIVATFTIKNNQPDGPARFYLDPFKPGAFIKNKDKWYYAGNYEKGQKEGEWIKNPGQNASTEHFLHGLKHGAFTNVTLSSYDQGWVPRGNGQYYHGKAYGRFYYYDKHKNLSQITYKDSLQKRDSFYLYDNEARLYKAFDAIYRAPKRRETDIYYKSISGLEVRNKISQQNFSYYKTFDTNGKLTSYIIFRNDSTYAFDSLLYGGDFLKVKQIPCQNQNDTAPCYETVNIETTPYKIRETSYYSGANLRRSKMITEHHYHGRDFCDTLTTLYLPASPANSWQLQVIERDIYCDKEFRQYELPAIGYFLYGRHFSNPPAWAFPWKTDSIHRHVYFRDTISDESKTINIISTTMVDAHDDDPDDVSVLFDDKNFLSLNSSHMAFHLCPDSLCQISQSTPFTPYTLPESISVYNKPYTGKAEIVPGKKHNFNSKTGVLSIGLSPFREWMLAARGRYTDGLKDSTWQFIGYTKRISPSHSLYSVFQQKQKAFCYTEVSFSGGLKHGPSLLYETYYPEDDYMLPKGASLKPVKYLSQKTSYVNDTLHGAFVQYHHNGNIIVQGTYRHGLLHDTLRYYTRDGFMYYEAVLNNGTLNGSLKEYDRDTRQLVKEAVLKDNALNGLYRLYNKDGSKWLEIDAHRGAVSSRKLFYENGVIKESVDLLPGCNYKLCPDIINTFNILECKLSYKKKGIRNNRKSVLTSTNDSLNAFAFNGSYNSYYNDGTLYATGSIKHFKPYGNWYFHNMVGQLTNHVVFRDTIIVLHNGDSARFMGMMNGYFYNGKPRCRAFVRNMNISYDCNTKKDLSAFETLIIDSYDLNGIQTCHNGTGLVKEYSETGLIQSSGMLDGYIKTGLWKYYDANQKLHEMGRYTAGLKDGIWVVGDLEGINYEDAACINTDDPNAGKYLVERQKKLQIEQYIYEHGKILQVKYYYIDLNRD